jgi:methyl halide transferase
MSIPEFLSPEYWQNRYLNAETQWDLKAVSPPLKAYIDQLENKDLDILIPGCGNGYEGWYLYENGFKNITLIDFASETKIQFCKNFPDFPQDQFITGDFFDLEGRYDLILEQTLFCAINPELRPKYVNKMYELLKKNGKLVGLFFDKQFESSPPFGGNQEEYLDLFSPVFSTISFQKCYNSIEPRKGSELFGIMIK